MYSKRKKNNILYSWGCIRLLFTRDQLEDSTKATDCSVLFIEMKRSEPVGNYIF